MKKMMIALFLCISTAGASEPQYDCDYEGSQREMNACAIRDYKQADRILNEAYAMKMHKLKTSMQRRDLLVEQRQWIKKRDARCLAKKQGEGTNVTIDYLSCLEMYTELRTAQLLR